MDEINMDSLDTSGLSDELYKELDLYGDAPKKKEEPEDDGIVVGDVGDYDMDNIDASALLSEMDDSSLTSLPKLAKIDPVSTELPELPKVPELGDEYKTDPSVITSTVKEMDMSPAEDLPPIKPVDTYTPTPDSVESVSVNQDLHPDPNIAPGVDKKYKRYSGADYAPQNVGSYRRADDSSSAYQPTGSGSQATGQYKTKMDELYEMRYKQDYELAEKGRKTAELMSTVGIIWYGINALLDLLSFSILNLIIHVLTIILLVQFRKGSNKAREYLGWFASISAFFGLLGLGSSLIGGGLIAGLTGSAALGVLSVISSLVSLVISVWLAWMFFADESITEYCKSMRDGKLNSGMEDSVTDMMTFNRFRK